MTNKTAQRGRKKASKKTLRADSSGSKTGRSKNRQSKPATRRGETQPAKTQSSKSIKAGSFKTSSDKSGGKSGSKSSRVREHTREQGQQSQTKPEAVSKTTADLSSKSSKKSTKKTISTKAPAQPTKAYFIEVDDNHAGQRVDNFLVTHLKGVPKTHIYRIIRKGEVRVNKGRVKQTTRLELGDLIRIPPIRLSDSSTNDLDGARYEFLKKTVLFEDDALLVINKPSGMAVHAGSGIKVGVIEALRALRTDLKYLELVHRLDRETSGCLVLAKKSSVLKTLHEDFKTNSLKNKRLDKRYFALVKGQWRAGSLRITKPLDTDARRQGERFVIVSDHGSYASSIVNPVAIASEASLLEVKLLTGRTHQVRVHLLSEGFPIAGDAKYGDQSYNKALKQQGLSRLFLHASSLEFTHPVSLDKVSISAPLPNDLLNVLDNLKLCIN